MIFIIIFSLIIVIVPVWIISHYLSLPVPTSRHDKSFQDWAFGPEFSSRLSIPEVCELWNKKHPDYIYSNEDMVPACINEMIELYDSVRENLT